jgi:hypothetical protein
MGFCLPKQFSDTLLNAIGSGDFNPNDYADQPDTAARQAYLAKFVGEENGKEANTLMESKMLLKDWQRGMVTAIKQMSGLKDTSKTGFVSRIAKMEKMLSPSEEKAFYADIAAKKLGVPVTPDVALKINELAQKANQALNAPSDNPSGFSSEYLKAARDLKSYITSQEPVSELSLIFRNITTTMRNFLLMNPATPLKTFIGQAENAGLDYVTRRIATASTGGVAKDAASTINTEAWKTYRETGLNTLSMESIDDSGKLGENRFSIPEGKISENPIIRGTEAATRAAAKYTSKVAIDWEHNITFTKFYQKTWTDMANIIASKMASGDTAKATEILNDAARIKPQTDAGKIVRQEAQYNAGRVTGTTDTMLSNASSKVVKYLDSQVPGLGNFLFQIVKIPTNLISYGIENAGGGLLKGPIDMLYGRKLMASDDLATKYKGAAQFAKGTQTLIRTVGVMTAASMIANTLNKNDFKTDNYGASYVKVGGTWVNMEYFYAISPAIAGMMDIKKNAKPNQNILDTSAEYVSGAASQLKALPLIDNTNTIITDMLNPSYQKGVGKYITSLGVDRLQPAFLRQLENAKGPNTDFLKGLFFSTTGLPTAQELAKLKAK